MADSKITALTALTAADPANDMMPIVDVSDTSMAASGTTKRISINNILACSPSATLASATITGDLTVDTSTLKVDSANNRVGIGTTSPVAPLDVRSNGNIAGLFLRTTDPAAAVSSAYIQAPVSSGFSSTVPIYGFWYQNSGMGNPAADTLNWIIASGEAMRLNSTGLGVGGSPDTGLFTVGSTGITSATTPSMRIVSNKATFVVTSDGATNGAGTTINYSWANGGQGPLIFRNASIANVMTLDASGNVGVGVTPNDKLTVLADNYLSFQTSTLTFNSGRVGRIGAVSAGSGNGYLVFETYKGGSGGGERMRIDSDGNVLIGTTTNAGVRLDVQTTTGNCIGRVKSNAAASTASFIIDYVETLGCTYIKKAGSDVWIYGVQNDTSATPAFKINTASNVGVQLVSGATAWTTLSDETVKDIIEPISNAVAKVGSIRSVIGKFKTDDSSKRRSFLIAQDVQSVLPEAVDVVGENNELGLRYTEVIPLLVAAIKELTAEVNALKNA